jgi:hypothetical protein
MGVPALAADSPTFAGEWDTTYGRLSIAVEGAKATGTYARLDATPNRINGTIEGPRLTFTYVETNATGEGHFTLAADGSTFRGQWREKGESAWSAWRGRRVAAVTRNFSGVWNTDYGLMRLVQHGDRVEGCYSFGGQSTVAGTAKGNVLSLAYAEPDGTTGTAEFTLAPDTGSFSGTWKPDGFKPGGSWNGMRVVPRAGRIWLVVLEARWEASLLEPEYSYGEMLRQFFTRVPEVAVRHRTFANRADFARWCLDLPYFVEPVVFYISSHGDQKGIRVGNELLGGKFIGEQLRHVPALVLVHLGACLTMAGNVPQEIRHASGQAVPVSGFTRTADWAGSAIIDFTYLDLVLARQLPPGEAAAEVIKSIAFAREKNAPDRSIAPAGLKIIE